MSLSDLRESYGDFYNPRFEVTADGNTYSEADGTVAGLTVSTALDRANRFSFALGESFDEADGRFEKRHRETFSEGATVEVAVGYGSELRTVVRGEIDAVRPTFPAGGGPTLSVSGHGLVYRMTKGSGFASWDETTLGTVAEAVARDYEFSGVEVDADVELEKVTQDQQSDYAFLDDLATAYGYEVFSRGGTFYFREPHRDREPKLTLEYGRSLRSFSPTDSGGAPAVGTVKVRHWDPVEKSTITGEAPVSGGGSETEVVRVPVRSREEAERRAEARAARLAKTYWSQAETIGIPDVKVGEPIRLEGIGETFSTTYYVERATHRVDGSGYSTSFEVSQVSSS